MVARRLVVRSVLARRVVARTVLANKGSGKEGVGKGGRGKRDERKWLEELISISQYVFPNRFSYFHRILKVTHFSLIVFR